MNLLSVRRVALCAALIAAFINGAGLFQAQGIEISAARPGR